MNSVFAFFRVSYARATFVLNYLQSPLLLAIRLYWGWQFAQDGWGKLHHLDKVTDYFTTLNLPAPHATAIFVALVQYVGGILFALGLGSRLVSLVLFVNMTVAFWTAEREAFLGVLSNPDKFQGAGAYNYWFAALLILILGPGAFALDWFLTRKGVPASASRIPKTT
ncbi:MAG TPA: DoxX family protein [Terracidiphilus sp.]|jgi:putative oxidoreductase|nr:DoxX family protein [Terracidiphilus sp.]